MRCSAALVVLAAACSTKLIKATVIYSTVSTTSTEELAAVADIVTSICPELEQLKSTADNLESAVDLAKAIVTVAAGLLGVVA